MAENHPCPSCDRTFDSEYGVKQHHAKSHGESIRMEVVECDYCGEVVKKSPSDLKKTEGTYCTHECYAKSKTKPETVRKECGRCGSEFVAEKNRASTYPEYCSDECRWPKRDGGDEVECTNCGNEVECTNCGEFFHRKPSRVRENNYCSQKCMGEHRQQLYTGEGNPNYRGGRVETSECIKCGDVFKHFKYSPGKFCSRSCLGQWYSGERSCHWKGGNRSYYGPNWYQSREACLERDNYECVVCGTGNEEHKEQQGEELNVHHIRRIKEFETEEGLDHEAANDLDNLVTLCRNCHFNWEGIPLRPEVVQC